MLHYCVIILNRVRQNFSQSFIVHCLWAIVTFGYNITSSSYRHSFLFRNIGMGKKCFESRNSNKMRIHYIHQKQQWAFTYRIGCRLCIIAITPQPPLSLFEVTYWNVSDFRVNFKLTNLFIFWWHWPSNPGHPTC